MSTMIKKRNISDTMKILLLFVLVCFLSNRADVHAQSQRYGFTFNEEYYKINIGTRPESNYKPGSIYSIMVDIYNYSGAPCTATISSSNEHVAQIVNGTNKITADNNSWQDYTLSCKILKQGTTTLTFSIGDVQKSIPLFVFSDSTVSIKNIKQTDYRTMNISWKKKEGYSGYYIMRAKEGSYDFEKIKTVIGNNTTSTAVNSTDWNKCYTYAVWGYIQNGAVAVEQTYYNDTVDFIMKKQSASISGIEKTGPSSLKIQWNKPGGALGYKLYRSNRENGTYKCIYTTKNPNITSFTQKVSKGTAYYYKIKTLYPKLTSDDSQVVSKMLPKSASVIKKTLSLSEKFYMGSQYGWNWASPDNAYYYTASGKLFMMVPDKNCLRIYTLNSRLKRTKTKKIKLKYDYFGGFYQGPDGSFYVAVGYKNPKENDKKTVIKIIKYNKKWKKGKTCNIKGSASNAFKGIYIPFDAGSCRMDIQGTTLYVHTCREMYAGNDGVHHQSNISFAINTKTMKGSTTGDVYASHSFNQYVKFDNGNLYLLDHGDAFPRNIFLNIYKDYRTVCEKNIIANLFSFKGNTGDNFTGCTVGGMEISENNVLVCGTSQPHYKKIKGVSGMKSSYAQNTYLIVANKDTGKSSVKWLTTYNPKKTKVQVGETRMVKLDDNRFAIMYTTSKANNKNLKLHYVVVDGKGKKVYSKTYSNMLFGGGTQPIVYNGRVVWADFDFATGKNKIYGVPALVK